ncbi:uncharacterized protein LOC143592692 [Bidens hawaiensis]|uniref:uncharacterized protein LOC143592692 n=1 Tax=Bidens hawaiensis TaxID=980011 RepID=UPI00404951A0
MAPGTSKTYISQYSITPHAGDHGDTEMLYTTEYLNLLNFNNQPPHQLELKPNVAVILLRNLNPTAGLCNGTRLIITQLLDRNIEAEIMTGTMIGRRLYIPRISLIHTDKELPFVFKRKQFPIKLFYAITINKSQCQSLDKIGVYLPRPVFRHGQLYVAMSKATKPEALKVLIAPYENDKLDETRNIVYSDFLDHVIHE